VENSEGMTEERRREPMGCLKEVEKLYYDKVAKGQLSYVTFRKLHSGELSIWVTKFASIHYFISKMKFIGQLLHGPIGPYEYLTWFLCQCHEMSTYPLPN